MDTKGRKTCTFLDSEQPGVATYTCKSDGDAGFGCMRRWSGMLRLQRPKQCHLVVFEMPLGILPS